MPPKASKTPSKTPSKAASSSQQPSLGSLPFNFGSMPPSAGKMEFKMQVSWKPDPAPSAPKTTSKTPRKRKAEGDSVAATPTPKKPRTPATAKGQTAARTPAKGKATAASKPKNNDAIGMGIEGGPTARSTPYHISNGRLLPDNGFSTSPSPSPFKKPQPPASTYKHHSSPAKHDHSASSYNSNPYSSHQAAQRAYEAQTASSYNSNPYSSHQAAQRAYEAQIARELGVNQTNPSDAPPSYEQSFYDREPEDDDDGEGNETCGYVFRFGKHFGKTFEQVLHDEPGYIDWCIRADVGGKPDRRDLALVLERYRCGGFD